MTNGDGRDSSGRCPTAGFDINCVENLGFDSILSAIYALWKIH